VDGLAAFVLIFAPLVAAGDHPAAFWPMAVPSPLVGLGLSKAIFGKLSWAFLVVATVIVVWASSIGIVFLLGVRLWGPC
jgi:hypothetical protein